MTNSRTPAAIGDLVYTHDAGTFTFTLGAKIRDGSMFWGHR